MKFEDLGNITATLSVSLVTLCVVSFFFAIMGPLGHVLQLVIFFFGLLISVFYIYQSAVNHRFHVLSLYVLFVGVFFLVGVKYASVNTERTIMELKKYGVLVDKYHEETGAFPKSRQDLQSLKILENVVVIDHEDGTCEIHYKDAVYFSSDKEIHFRPAP